MGIRARVYDDWLREKMDEFKDSAVIHIGCGLDSRVLRVGTNGHKWYDVDFADVINERKLYYTEDDNYRMLEGDARKPEWLSEIPENKCAVVVMEGISMYLKSDELKALIAAINSHFDSVALMIDFYTTMGAKISKYKNPINDVGVTEVYGTDTPEAFEMDSFSFIKEHNMVPDKLVNELKGMEKCLFRSVYGGKLSKKIYRLFEYSSI